MARRKAEIYWLESAHRNDVSHNNNSDTLLYYEIVSRIRLEASNPPEQDVWFSAWLQQRHIRSLQDQLEAFFPTSSYAEKASVPVGPHLTFRAFLLKRTMSLP